MKNKEIFELEEMAIEGNIEAAKELARRYKVGDGIEVDIDIASKWEEFAGLNSVESLDSNTFEDSDLATEIESTLAEKVQNWSDIENKYNSCSIIELRSKSNQGDPYATAILGCKYFTADSAAEMEEGKQLLEDAIQKLKLMMSDERQFESNKDILVHIYYLLGRYYFNNAATAKESEQELAFRCFSNIYELGSEIPDELIDCYNNGFGTNQNIMRGYELRAEKVNKEERKENAVQYQSDIPVYIPQSDLETILKEYKKLTREDLMKKVSRNDLFAGIVIGERKIKSDSLQNRIQGAEDIKNVIEILKDNCNNELCRAALAYNYMLLGDYYIESVIMDGKDLEMMKISEINHSIIF